MDYLKSGLDLLKQINSLGYDAYIVGGAVRDYLLKREVNDVDIATNLSLDEIKKHFEVLDTGLKYLSVTVIYNGYKFETTNFRRDLKYYNNRFPDVEIISDFKTDTLRRDFTVNAMAFDKDKNLIDYHGGMEDLNKHLLRAIGTPKVRFDEDALRILRCLHFSSKLDFDIEEETLKAMVACKSNLKSLSNERIYEYVEKIIRSNNKKGIEYINKYDLFEDIVEYKNVLEFAKPDYTNQDISLIYYLKYKKYFPITKSTEKRIINHLIELIDDNFSNYSIYKNQNIIEENKNVFKYFGYDFDGIVLKKNNLIIKSDNELALSKEEISMMFPPSDRSKVIKDVISKILDKKLENDKVKIRKYLEDNYEK
ncbi:MAG: hypothetical protein IJU60_04280 [Acholeplasmatales bacterium]|nr:hypothetical protein [Acholeplasmatales bacterium]